MRLDVLYFCGETTAFAASSRIASTRMGLSAEEIEAALVEDGEQAQQIYAELADSNITFSFGSPISWKQVGEELDAYLKLHDGFPEVIVFSSLVDFEGAEDDHIVQAGLTQSLAGLACRTGSIVTVWERAEENL